MKKLLVELDDDAHARLKIVAASDGTTMRHLVTTLANGLFGDDDARTELKLRLEVRNQNLPIESRMAAEGAVEKHSAVGVAR